MFNVQKKFIKKGESHGNICVDFAVQHGAVHCSLLHYISVQCSVIQCSIVQCSVATAVQCNSVHFNLV